MLVDYTKANIEIKDLPRLGIEPQSPDPQPVDMAMSYNDPFLSSQSQAILKRPSFTCPLLQL